MAALAYIGLTLQAYHPTCFTISNKQITVTNATSLLPTKSKVLNLPERISIIQIT
jgi:hypothetical protein